jgi:cation:H+ antiporter
MNLGQFLISAAVVVIAGMYLSRYGDFIARKTGLSGLWIGVVLVAAATSLPEVVADISAAIIGVPDLAVGDILGSGMANMLVLAIISLFYQRIYRRPSLLREVTLTHATTATLAMLLTALTGIFMLVRLNVGVFNVGIDTLILAVIYLTAMWTLFGHERAQRREKLLTPELPEVAVGSERISLRGATIGFAAATLAIAVAAPSLVSSAKTIALQTGIGPTFMGTLFLGLVTSAPELAVSLSAIRIGAFDLAVGDIFGSNAFNIFILFLTDIAYRQGALLSAVSEAHIATALVLLILMSVGIIGLVFRAEKQYFLLVPDALLIIAIYVIGMFMLFRLSVAG